MEADINVPRGTLTNSSYSEYNTYTLIYCMSNEIDLSSEDLHATQQQREESPREPLPVSDSDPSAVTPVVKNTGCNCNCQSKC